MQAGWKMFLLFTVIFAVALGVQWLFVPDIVPIGFAEEPQPQWAVQVAFLLRTIELLSAAVALIALALMAALWARGRLRPL
jgi:hypothetical protein